jgi:putative oxidoreductase
MAGFSEAVGGVFLILGFQTRIASLLILTTMLGAIFLQQIQSGIWNTLPALGFLWVSLYTLILGSGRFGIDYLFINKTK